VHDVLASPERPSPPPSSVGGDHSTFPVEPHAAIAGIAASAKTESEKKKEGLERFMV
jgi:hypothetical protein